MHGETEITTLFSLTPNREPSHEVLRTEEIYFPNACGIHRALEAFPPTFPELGYGPEVESNAVLQFVTSQGMESRTSTQKTLGIW